MDLDHARARRTSAGRPVACSVCNQMVGPDASLTDDPTGRARARHWERRHPYTVTDDAIEQAVRRLDDGRGRATLMVAGSAELELQLRRVESGPASVVWVGWFSDGFDVVPSPGSADAFVEVRPDNETDVFVRSAAGRLVDRVQEIRATEEVEALYVESGGTVRDTTVQRRGDDLRGFEELWELTDGIHLYLHPQHPDGDLNLVATRLIRQYDPDYDGFVVGQVLLVGAAADDEEEADDLPADVIDVLDELRSANPPGNDGSAAPAP